MGQLDFQNISSQLLVNPLRFLEAWLPGGKLVGKEYTCGSINGGSGKSFKVNIQTGAWCEFAGGEQKGGDLISLYAAIHGMNQGESARKLAREVGLGLGSNPRPKTSPPKNTLAPPPKGEIPVCRHPKHGMPTSTWTYRGFDGAPLFYVSRYDSDGKKEFLPWSWDKAESKWVNKGWPAPRPLLNLDKLAAAKHLRVLLTEGEKAALAAEALIGDKYTVMTWPNGSSSWTKADWQPLHGKEILIWPDADEAGMKCAKALAAFLVEHCPLVKVIDVSDHSNGWDAADAIKEGWDTAKFVDWAKPRAAIFEKPEAPQPEPQEQQNGSFVSNGDPAVYESLLQSLTKVDPEQITEVATDIISPYFRKFTSSRTSLVFKILKNETKEVELCTNEEYLKMHVATEIRAKYGITMKLADVEKILDMWRLYGPNLSEEPTPFAWPSEDLWTFKKLAFEPTEGKFDSWVEFLYRLSSPDDFMAFVWSIFEKKNRSRQFLYLHDPAGQGGKSTVIGVLGEIFGGAFASISNSFVGGGGGRWLMGHLYGKRFAAWADCKNPKFCMSEVVRNITSGDSVPIEFKGEQTFNAPMYVKLIIGSNYAPEITGTAADKSRLIRIEVKRNAVSHNDPEWPERLRQELPHFLWECKKYYDQQCRNHGNLKLQVATIDQIEQSTEGLEAEFEDIAGRRLLFDADHKCPIGEWRALCKAEGMPDQRQADFKAFLVRTYPGVSFVRKNNAHNKRTSFYRGFTLNQMPRTFDSM